MRFPRFQRRDLALVILSVALTVAVVGVADAIARGSWFGAILQSTVVCVVAVGLVVVLRNE